MTRGQGDPEREERIEMEIIADCYDATERALGWYYYLQDRLQSPFTARCIVRRATSPLHIGDEVEVTAMAPEEVCAHEMFVMIRWEREGLTVPLAQINPVGADAETVQAIEDWHYWARQGYRF
jgi:hypothetical protein